MASQEEHAQTCVVFRDCLVAIFYSFWLFMDNSFTLIFYCVVVSLFTVSPLYLHPSLNYSSTEGHSLSLRCTLYRLLFCALVEVFFFPVVVNSLASLCGLLKKCPFCPLVLSPLRPCEKHGQLSFPAWTLYTKQTGWNLLASKTK